MTGDIPEVHSVPTITHGRVLIVPARAAAARGLVVGFHGYGETAATQMERLQAIPAAAPWVRVSVQGLHRFYERRTGQVIASWMTQEDREDAIADNIAYITAAIETAPADPSLPLVFAGFSQGVAMAYRAACRGPRPAAAIISVGGDVHRSCSRDPSITFPRVLLIRGRDDSGTRSRNSTTTPRRCGRVASTTERCSSLVATSRHQPVLEAAGRLLGEI